MGVPPPREAPYELWLDLRTSELTFAQQALVQLFYAVRRVVDEAGKALPRGAKVQGLLFAESRYDRADTIGADVPIFLFGSEGGISNATLTGEAPAVPVVLRSPMSVAGLRDAQEELDALSSGGAMSAANGTPLAAIALPAEPMLWALALTGLNATQLESLEANAGA